MDLALEESTSSWLLALGPVGQIPGTKSAGAGVFFMALHAQKK
jgi:hypothetical protein